MKVFIPFWMTVLSCVSLISFQSCSEGGSQVNEPRSDESDAMLPASESTQGADADRKVDVSVAASDLHAFVGMDTLEIIASNLDSYFQSTNDGDWDQLMRHFPLHKRSDTAFTNSSKRALQMWWENGVRNRTEMAEILYASPAALDGDQQVVLLNMKLKHIVEFHPFYTGTNPSGMKGMVESNYGKGNATYFEDPLAEGDSLPFRYWEINGLNRIWAVSHVDSSHWCFLPPNFNEGGAANMMSSDAMVQGLRHRRANDPTASK
ncbi:MAG TPA: hypothetical protein DCX00_03740 [Flavobacteriales bacterium]|nr:hypothetical protein [Flavobacteriales bacterium]